MIRRLGCRRLCSATSSASVPTPYPFQEVAIKRLLMPGRRGLLLADEMGLGKTVSVIGALNREPKIKSVLVVAPKSVIHVWKLELSRWLSRPLSVGLASASKGLPKEPTQILLINYDIVRKHREELDALAPWDVLVCDEAHYLKNPEILRTQALLGRTGDRTSRSADPDAPVPGALRARRVWLLTGSPVLNQPVELYPLLRTLDPYSETVPRAFSFNSFRVRYSVREETQWGVKYKGAANTAELRRLLLLGCDTIPPIMLRRTKAEVLTDLPAKHHQLLPIVDEKVARDELRVIKRLRKEMAIPKGGGDGAGASADAGEGEGEGGGDGGGEGAGEGEGEGGDGPGPCAAAGGRERKERGSGAAPGRRHGAR